MSRLPRMCQLPRIAYLLFGALGLVMLPACSAETDAASPASAAAAAGFLPDHRPVVIQKVAPRPPELVKPPATTFGDGKYEVGTDIAPGQYKTAGATAGQKCYWARLSNLNGTIRSALAMGYDERGPNVVVIEPMDKGFESRSCGTWRQVPAR